MGHTSNHHSAELIMPLSEASVGLGTIDIIGSLLERTTDLRESFTFLTGREAPAHWRRPDWRSCDAATLKAIIYNDFLSAFTEYGVDVNGPYREYPIWDGDGYDVIWDWCYEEIACLVSEAVDYRIQRHGGGHGV